MPNTGDEITMRADRAAAVAGVIAGLNATADLTLTKSEVERLLPAADLVTLARTGVEFDYKGDDRHRLAESVLGHAGAGRVEDRLTRRPGVGLLALLIGPPPPPHIQCRTRVRMHLEWQLLFALAAVMVRWLMRSW
jgi:hypothetical protein